MHVLKDKLARVRRAKRDLPLLILCRETRSTFRDDEAANRAVILRVAGLRPDNRHLGRGPIRDPHLSAVEYPRAVGLLPGAGDHPRWVRPIIRFSQTEAADYLAA